MNTGPVEVTRATRIQRIKRSMKVGLCAGCLIASGIVLAGPQEVGAAKGLMIASILHEKCTGKDPIPNETERQMRMLQGQGLSVEDIKRGFWEGMIYAESTYPGDKKPSKSECNKAINLYWQARKHM